jgi:ribosome modulation factor
MSDTQDPRDRALEGLQDARDDSDPGPEPFSEEWFDGFREAWRDRYDTREEYEDR